jgi:signal peptidase I
MEQSNITPSFTPTPTVPPKTTEKKKGVLRDFFEAFVIALVIALPIKFFIASPFIVVGTSMYPTFKGSDYLVVDKIAYRFGDPKRGDVIVFTPPVNVNEYYIKRIIGLPGETLHINGNSVTIINKDNPKGFVLSEPYVSSLRSGVTDIVLKDDEYFVMGDNRSVSSDSRVWGPIHKSAMSGRADVRLFPINAIGIMPGAISN